VAVTRTNRAATVGVEALRLQSGIGEIFPRVVAHHLDVPCERGVIGELDLETHGEAEAGTDGVEVVLAGVQDDLTQWNAATQVDLDPLDRVGFQIDRAVITEGVTPGGRLRERLDFLLEIGEWNPGSFANAQIQ
jgi:hypothetical protein